MKFKVTHTKLKVIHPFGYMYIDADNEEEAREKAMAWLGEPKTEIIIEEISDGT